jgi:hypothetical protein
LYYSLYPSFPTEKSKKKNNIKIKIYTDLSSPDNFSILPVRFCPFRNCFVFDIPKKKFPSYKKIMNFNFISNNNKVKIDKKYKVVLFGNEKVNQIDFRKFDKKESAKNNYHKLSITKEDSSESESSNSDSYSNSENENENENNFENENENNEEESEKKQDLNENLDINDFLNHNITNLNKNYSNKIENELILSNTMSNSTKDSISLNSPTKKCKKKKRSKSILKNGGRNSVTKDRLQIRRTSTNKRVSFGSSQISFYRSQLLK